MQTNNMIQTMSKHYVCGNTMPERGDSTELVYTNPKLSVIGVRSMHK